MGVLDVMTEHSAYNLIRERWIPVRRCSGAVERISPAMITDRIAEDPIASFAWPRPDFDGAARELMIGLLATAAAPAGDSGWAEWWLHPPSPAVLEERFAEISHAFDLDGAGPRFMQDLDPLDMDPKEISTVLIDAPGVQTLKFNADHFQKRGGVPVLSRAAVAMAVYVLNLYAPSGGAGHRTSLRGGGPMTTLVAASHLELSDTLWSRLWPNVETKEQIEQRNVGSVDRESPGAIFPWLAPTRTSDLKKGGRTTSPADVHPLHVYWAMPRRIRLIFENSAGRVCGLTGGSDEIVVSQYRTKNYGADYTEGFAHPLSPYYRPKSGTVKLPVHPKPGGVSYRLWPGLVVRSASGSGDPASVVSCNNVRARSMKQSWKETRLIAFGYDMDNMKARSWVEAEWPLWLLESEAKRDLLTDFIEKSIAGAEKAASLLVYAVKSALYARVSDAQGDYSHIRERFYHESEGDFLGKVGEAIRVIENDSERIEDPSMDVRKDWATRIREAVLPLFGEYAASDGLEHRNMHRHVKAYFNLEMALKGFGKDGKALFKVLDIPVPEPKNKAKREISA